MGWAERRGVNEGAVMCESRAWQPGNPPLIDFQCSPQAKFTSVDNVRAANLSAPPRPFVSVCLSHSVPKLGLEELTPQHFIQLLVCQ
jgi:hypothetical protein